MDDFEHPRFPSMALSMIESIAEEQAATFSILRRPHVASDGMPKVSSDAFSNGVIGRIGCNPALARRAATSIGDVWVVPGNGFLALRAVGVGATSTEVVARQGMLSWTSQDGKGIVHGLVPDGVSEVTVFWCESYKKPESTGVAIVVRDNVFGAALPGYFRGMSFVGPAGVVELGPYG